MWIGICDDQPDHLSEACNKIESYTKTHNMLCQISTFETMEQYTETCHEEQQSCDVLFVDIKWGDENGIEFARQVNQEQPYCQIVFLTNYASYALDVYAVEHCYFVLKTQLEQRLPDIFSRLSYRLLFVEQSTIFLEAGKQRYRIAQRNIMYIERRGRYSYIYCSDISPIKVGDKLPILLDKLDKAYFNRCHVSYIVNLFYIYEFTKENLFLKSGQLIPVSRSYQRSTDDHIMRWAGEH